MKLRCVALLSLTLGTLMPVPAFAVSLAVKRGQTEVDPKTLPFASFTITMEDGSLPLQKIVLIDVATGKDVAVSLQSSFSSKVDYLTASENNRRMHAQIILPLKAGEYEFKRIEFNSSHSNQIGDAQIDMSKVGHFRFKVMPQAVNYCGSLSITTDWAKLRSMRSDSGRIVERTFSLVVRIEKTQERDAAWAGDVIPGMRGLPSVVSSIEKK